MDFPIHVGIVRASNVDPIGNAPMKWEALAIAMAVGSELRWRAVAPCIFESPDEAQSICRSLSVQSAPTTDGYGRAPLIRERRQRHQDDGHQETR
ncbi:MAG: hypothetical protein JSS01_02450 [Proteobacteria bacterium]|nr:hypothetical protein [Pseudomonadota bacterium]